MLEITLWNPPMKYFHDYVKAKRLERKLTLREFCRKAALDPSNWSKIERGVADPPKSIEMLSRIATVLEFRQEELATLKDLALIEFIPPELRPADDVLEKLPILFRTARGEKPTKEELRRLYEILEKNS
jgi:transcriptional regulator with XRE-family HTH domain